MARSQSDYLSLQTDSAVRKAFAQFGSVDEQVVFSDVVVKINRKDRQQERILVITDRALYNFSRPYKNLKRRIELGMLAGLTTSSSAPEFVVHVPSEYDYRLRCSRKDEIVEVLVSACYAVTGAHIPVRSVANPDLRAVTALRDPSKLSKTGTPLKSVDSSFDGASSTAGGSGVLGTAALSSPLRSGLTGLRTPASEDDEASTGAPTPGRSTPRAVDSSPYRGGQQPAANQLWSGAAAAAASPHAPGAGPASRFPQGPSLFPPLPPGYPAPGAAKMSPSVGSSAVTRIPGYSPGYAIDGPAQGPSTGASPASRGKLPHEGSVHALALPPPAHGYPTAAATASPHPREGSGAGAQPAAWMGLGTVGATSGAFGGAGAASRDRLDTDAVELLAAQNEIERADTGHVTGWSTAESLVGLADFELLRVIGRGSYGKVVQVRKRDTGEVLAMKILKKSVVVQRNQVDHTQAERAILESMDHPFLIKLKYAFQTDTKLYLVLPYLRGGEVFYHLKHRRRFDDELARFYIAEIALGLGHLHAVGIVYRDLKPENVLLDEEGHVKLTDFGLSKVLATPSDTARTFCGTPEYLAPEVIDGHPHDTAVDWWGLGVLLWEMLTGLPPFYNQNVQVMYDMIRACALTFPPYMSQRAVTFISDLLQRDPAKRLGNRPGDNDVEAVKAHPFFAGMDWVALYERRLAPPWRPPVVGSADVTHFDGEFTSEPVVDSVISGPGFEPGSMNPKFDGFTFCEPSEFGKSA